MAPAGATGAPRAPTHTIYREITRRLRYGTLPYGSLLSDALGHHRMPQLVCALECARRCGRTLYSVSLRNICLKWSAYLRGGLCGWCIVRFDKCVSLSIFSVASSLKCTPIPPPLALSAAPFFYMNMCVSSTLLYVSHSCSFYTGTALKGWPRSCGYAL